MCSALINVQNEDGYFGGIISLKDNDFLYPIKTTAFCVVAISRCLGYNSEYIQKAVYWLKSLQLNDGSWEYRKNYFIDRIENSNNMDVSSVYFGETKYALMALFAAGEGPKIPLETFEWENILQNQKQKTIKPYFIHTSPIYGNQMHKKEIHDKVREMLKGAQKEIRICSLYIDFLYEDIINIAAENQELNIKILCRPGKDIGGLRERICKNVIDLLKIASKGNLRTNPVFHSRMIIIDDKELMVSSSDLTRDQLFDEFNAGIYTNEKDSIQKAVNYFDNIWINSSKN